MFLRHLELLQLNHLHMNTQKKYKAEMHKASQLAASFPPSPVAEHPCIPVVSGLIPKLHIWYDQEAAEPR